MPTWTKSPPEDQRGPAMPLVRTPAARPLNAVVTSPTLIGTDTHFWGGHTVPCERPDCDACKNGITYNWHGYLSAYNPNDQLHFIFEMTAQAAQVFVEYQKENKTLRCCQFEAYRWRRAKNGRVIIRCEHSAIPEHALPRAPDLTKVMAVIWRLPIPTVQTDGIHRNVSRVQLYAGNNGQSTNPKLYDQPQP